MPDQRHRERRRRVDLGADGVRRGRTSLLGGGKAFFGQTIKGGPFVGQTVLPEAQAAGYQIVTDAAGLAAASNQKPILGLFAPGNMDLEWTGPTPTPTNTAGVDLRGQRRADGEPAAPGRHDQQGAEDARRPSPRVTRRASSCRSRARPSTSRTTRPTRAARSARPSPSTRRSPRSLQYQRSHPDTLVVVTADHGHTSQIVATGSTTTGVTATLTTPDGAPMTISYATTPFPASQQHTGTEVRIAAERSSGGERPGDHEPDRPVLHLQAGARPRLSPARPPDRSSAGPVPRGAGPAVVIGPGRAAARGSRCRRSPAPTPGPWRSPRSAPAPRRAAAARWPPSRRPGNNRGSAGRAGALSR